MMRALSFILLSVLTAGLLAGCGKKSETPEPVPVQPEPAADAADETSKVEREGGNTLMAVRLEDETYTGALREIETTRRDLTLEANELQEKMVDRAETLARENDLEPGAALSPEILQNDPEYQDLAASLRAMQEALVALRAKATAVVRQQMQEQFTAHQASKPDSEKPTLKRPEGVLKTEPGRREPVDAP